MLPRLLHGLWALLGLAVCVVLVTSRGGHPPAIVLLPVALPVWAGGHLLLWGAGRLHRRALARRPAAGPDRARAPWPILVTLAGSGLLAFVGFWSILVSWALADGREEWLGSGWLWVTVFLPWVAHAICFLALVTRHPASGRLAAGVWAGWGALLVWLVAVELSRYGVRDAGELALALALIAAAFAMAGLVWRSRYPARTMAR